MPANPLRLLVVAADASVGCRQIIPAAGPQRKSDQVLLATIAVSFLAACDQQFAPFAAPFRSPLTPLVDEGERQS
jgi:hypothetical protein